MFLLHKALDISSMSGRVLLMPLYWNWPNNLFCLLFNKDFSKKKDRISSVRKTREAPKYVLRNVVCHYKKRFSSTFKINKVNLNGKAQLMSRTILISEHWQIFHWNQLAKKSCHVWSEVKLLGTYSFKYLLRYFALFLVVPCWEKKIKHWQWKGSYIDFNVLKKSQNLFPLSQNKYIMYI